MNISSIIMLTLSMLMALVAMAFYTLVERKFLGYFQLRKGPNKVGIMGLPQPFADAIKLFIKERSNPNFSNTKIFYLAPVLGLSLSIMLWTIYPHSSTALFLTYGTLYFLCVSSMNVYVIFISGWSSNSKYALLGALRGVAQTISYEVSMAIILLTALMILYSMDLHLMASHLFSWISIMASPIFLLWFITNLAETNRTPFDLAEGESELVSGFNTEFSGGLFALIFMAEYSNIIVMSLISAIIFTGTIPVFNNFFIVIKTLLLSILFIWIRATMPRMRYDCLMSLTWKSFLPVSLTFMLLVMMFLM